MGTLNQQEVKWMMAERLVLVNQIKGGEVAPSEAVRLMAELDARQTALGEGSHRGTQGLKPKHSVKNLRIAWAVASFSIAVCCFFVCAYSLQPQMRDAVLWADIATSWTVGFIQAVLVQEPMLLFIGH